MKALGLALISLLSTLSANTLPIAPSGKLPPGEFQWRPDLSPKGPMLVVCSIDDQMLYAYRNGILIARSTISTGREGKETPTGVFTILQRKIDHESNIYKGAKMPYMQRLTWTGIAMHAGKLPGYPASAGCIRLPYDFSKLIYKEMAMGSTVVISNKSSQPTKSANPASILLSSKSPNPEERITPKGTPVWEPQKSPTGPITMLLSYADKTLYVWRAGIQIGQSPVAFKSSAQDLPEGVFLMLDEPARPDPKNPGRKLHSWSVVSFDGANGGGDIVSYIRDNVALPPNFRTVVEGALHPGTLLLATREASTEETRSKEMVIGAPDQLPDKTSD